MEKVKLQFQTPQDFAKFRRLIEGHVLDISIYSLTITCECSKSEIAHAMNYMGARVIEN